MSNTLANSLELPNARKKTPLSSAELGMMVTLASFGMLFGTFFLSYLLARTRSAVWPPIGVEPIPKNLSSLSTLILLLSSVLIYQAEGAFRAAAQKRFLKLWCAATGCGLAFLATQVLLWIQVSQLGVRADATLYGSIFYTLIALHGVHILAGLGILIFVGFRATTKDFFSETAMASAGNRQSLSEAPKLAAWFWHFLDAMWLIMYALLVWI